MADLLRGPAPAKVNLVLEVLGQRDDGYHAIDTILQTLALADEVTITFDRSAGLSASGPFADGTPLDETNLAWRAAAGLAERLDRPTAGLSIHLEKRIPPAGGLGGGASDAAAVLRLLGHAWDAPATVIGEVAADVGSDEPFLVIGGTARAQGRGEVVTPLPALGPHAVVLFIPPETIEHKTARMFAAIDRLPFDSRGVAAVFAAAPPGRFRSQDVFNAFERVAFDLFPALAVLWESIEARLGEPVHLAGAGPTLFWIGEPNRGAAIAQAAHGLACEVVATATAGRP